MRWQGTIIGSVIALWMGGNVALAQIDGIRVEHRLIEPYQRAQAAMARGDWDRAWVIAAQEGRLIHDYVEWTWLRAGRGDPTELLSFLDRRSDWPDAQVLRRRGEVSLDIATHDEVLRLFVGSLPETGRGALALAAALDANGQSRLAENVLINAWVRLRLGEAEEAAILVAHSGLLAPYHTARLNNRLWADDINGAQRMLPLVNDAEAQAARTHLAYLRGDPRAEELFADVPESHAGDPGLAYRRYERLIAARDYDEATALLAQHSLSPEHLGDPQSWANWRRWLTRRALREATPEEAYWLAASHGLTEGAAFADLEFLAGYIALRHLERPDWAAQHFTALGGSVRTPISLSRAHFWRGEAHAAQGDEAEAEAAYRDAAQYWSAFYGLMALDRLDEPLPQIAEPGGDWQQADFRFSSVWQLATLAYAAGDRSTALRFYTHLVTTLDEGNAELLGQMAEEFGDPNLALEIAKQAARASHVVASPYFPLHPMAEADLGPPPERALAIARRESEFRIGLTSPAGAQGMMQLMPGTARAMAETIDVPIQPRRVLDDWVYNAVLGGAYLSEMAKEFNGNPVMIAAAYNAGPSRPRGWMEAFGDPRRGEIDIIDWIEMIPFRETRNYVMRVTEAEAIYAARFGRPVEDFEAWLASEGNAQP